MITFARDLFYRAIGFNRSVQEAFDQANVALMLEGIPEEDTPELLSKAGINPSEVFPLLPSASPAIALMPERLRALIESSGQFIIDLPQFHNIPNANLQPPSDYLFCELKMREIDWAEEIRQLLDVDYPKARKVKLIFDNLNTHKLFVI